MTIRSFAPFRRIHHYHHRRNRSDDSTSSGTMDEKEDARSRYERQKAEAREIWSKTQPKIKNEWQWPNPPAGRGEIDASKEYAERTISTPDETLEDVTIGIGLQRKRLHRIQVREEARWNVGLKAFEERRKAWTGAVDVFLPPGEIATHERVKIMQEDPAGMLAQIQGDQDGPSDDSSMEIDTSASKDLNPSMSEFGTTLLPIYKPTLPNTLALTQPLPNTAAERVLYKNLVAEGKTAVAPIPLVNVIRACVTGLIDADEWPLKEGAIDPLVGQVNKDKRKSKIKSLLKLGRDNDAMALDSSILAAQTGFDTNPR